MYVCINIWTDVCSNAPCSSILSCTMSYWTLLFQSYCGHTSCVHITDIRTHIHIHIYIYMPTILYQTRFHLLQAHGTTLSLHPFIRYWVRGGSQTRTVFPGCQVLGKGSFGKAYLVRNTEATVLSGFGISGRCFSRWIGIAFKVQVLEVWVQRCRVWGIKVVHEAF